MSVKIKIEFFFIKICSEQGKKTKFALCLK